MAEIQAGFEKLFSQIESVSNRARSIAEGVIDTETETFRSAVEKGVPVQKRPGKDRGGLRASLRVDKDPRGGGYYGWKVEFEGNTSDGTPWMKVANIINYGSIYRPGTGFIDKAKHKLKGMNDRINARIEAEFDKNIDT